MSHNGNHTHKTTNYNKVFGVGILLNVVYTIVEAGYGIAINSMALIADAGHNLSDVLGLVLAWSASYLAQTAATKTKTYGMRKSTILAALLNSIILMIAVGAISIEAVRKIITPEPVAGTTMMIVAGIGVVVNTFTALLFLKGRNKDLNIRGAFLHMAADAGVSLGVVAGGLIISLTGWNLIDPIISVIIVVVITIGTWGLLKDSFYLSMDAVPKGIDYSDVENFLKSLNGVNEVHDLHIWGLSTTESALTAHLVMPALQNNDKFIAETSKALKDKFGIDHTTIQIEIDPGCADCSLNGK
ncbi:cation diffusion facilitator family transporter [Bacteroidota bacterium]